MIGVQLFGCINCYILNNVFLNNSFTGIFIFNSNNNIISGNIILNNTIGILFLASIFNMISRNSFENNVYNLFLVISSCNLIQYNNFKYQKKISNILSGDSDNKYMGNFWNKPRLLPIIIWGFKTNRFGFIPFLPSLDVDWRPAKKPNDIDSTENRWAEFEIVIPRTRASNLQYLRLLEQYPLLKQFLQRLTFL
jgi:parallel beta-helix repeat protein